MLTLLVTFPAGRYHATPWGMHVNEGAIEWPPSPWRLCRALLAVGFQRLGWSSVPPTARALLERLAEHPPRYGLPSASASHTRHYMPLYGDKTTKVIDAFAYVGKGSLGIEFDADLDDGECALLDELLDALPYLGRAESWTDVRRVAHMPDDLVTCEAAESPPGPNYERIALLALERPSVYEAWRAEAVARENLETERAQRAKAAEKGKSWKGLTKKDLARIEAMFPVDVVDALRMTTAALQSAGWSQPPGARWLSYWRREGALRTTPASTSVVRRLPRTTTALLALSSDTRNVDAFPSLADALPRLEAIHDALVKRSTGNGVPSPCFIGKVNGIPVDGHRHASLLPLCLGRRPARLDHVLVHAPMGFDAAARDALGSIRKIYAKNFPDLFVTLAGIGTLDSFATLIRHVGRASSWESTTPFVPSRHMKTRGKDTLPEQIRAELRWRGLPEPKSIAIELRDGTFAPLDDAVPLVGPEASSLRFRHYRRERAERPAPCARSFSLRLEFEKPVAGPVSLGYASHFGLGLFVPC